MKKTNDNQNKGSRNIRLDVHLFLSLTSDD